jgi:hypothetical protein
MSIVNKRNAVLGWATWKVGKRVAKKKARTAVPNVEDGRPNKPAIAAAGAAALAGSLFFWKKARRRPVVDGGGSGSDEAE